MNELGGAAEAIQIASDLWINLSISSSSDPNFPNRPVTPSESEPEGVINRPEARINPGEMFGLSDRVLRERRAKKEPRVDMESPSTSGAAAVHQNRLQPIQPATALSGGIIWAAPVSIVGVPNVPMTTSGGPVNGGTAVTSVAAPGKQSGGAVKRRPISVVGPHEAGKQSLTGSKPNPNRTVCSRRNPINQVKNSVGRVVENLQKTIAEAVKASLDEITVEIKQNGQNSVAATAEFKALKEENEMLRKQISDAERQAAVAAREMKATMEAEIRVAVESQRKRNLADLKRLTEEYKKKQWCAVCGDESQLYCCWNTSYCDFPCQETHWPDHMDYCAQDSNNVYNYNC